jgi:hypothetical protein
MSMSVAGGAAHMRLYDARSYYIALVERAVNPAT